MPESYQSNFFCIMSLTLIVLAEFYAPARHAIAYADTLAQAVGGQLVLLHVNRAGVFDPYELAGPAAEGYRREELERQADTVEALQQLALELRSPAVVEVATDLVPALARDETQRHRPALFVLGQPDPSRFAPRDLAIDCAELLRASNYPLLVVPPSASITRPPHHFLFAADAEPFALTATSRALRDLFAQLATDTTVAYVSESGADDERCSAALRTVESSGLFVLTPELRGYQDRNYAQGLLAAVQDTQADLVVAVARQRSYLGEVFHRSVTVRLLAHCPVPVLLLPTVADAARAGYATDTARWAAVNCT